ncbi:enoyl-CoA hydratase/isomerase family protein [Flavobacteriaceae bacterium Ap0902]|nr:enoyl-CoA hydratase/isomerase family protein [Flavobacteriaceae bacterium Ap0902]
MTEPYIKNYIHDGIATIEFFHPKSNSFPTSQLNALIDTFKTLGEDSNVKVIILKSAGEKVFCAGASFDELLTIDDFDTGKKFFMGFANLILAMRDCPKFIIGQIEGKVVGGGVGLTAACDYTLALNNASIKLSELSIGIGPFVIEPAITRKIGINAFSELTLNPKEWVLAHWCKEAGLYNDVFETREELIESCEAFAQQLSQYSPAAMHHLKSIFWENAQNWNDIMPQRAAMSGELVLSEFTKSTLQKFKSK